jgi:hypothetical protein
MFLLRQGKALLSLFVNILLRLTSRITMLRGAWSEIIFATCNSKHQQFVEVEVNFD